jgi:hypothetical protein
MISLFFLCLFLADVRLTQCPGALFYRSRHETVHMMWKETYRVACPCGTNKKVFWHKFGVLVPDRPTPRLYTTKKW